MSKNSPDTEPVLRPHEYDGIQEYDQKLPNWWLFSWYIMMVAFVVCWVVYYQVGIGMSDEKEIATAMAKIADYQKKELEQISDDKLWAMSKDAKIVAAGSATYQTTCVACHAPDMTAMLAGAKLPGLPLSDQEWKHGNHPTQLLTIIRKGAPDVTKGMPPWEPQLGLQRVVEVLAYVLSKHTQGEPFTLAVDSPLKKAGVQ